MTKERARKQSDIIKELRAHIEKQNSTVKAITNDLFISGNREMELQEKVGKLEAALGAFKKHTIETGQAYDTVIHRLNRALFAIIQDMSDVTRVPNIQPRELKPEYTPED